MNTAVVTGATGFIGKAFTEYLLEKGYVVYAVIRDDTRLNGIQVPNLIPVKADYSAYGDLSKLISHADIFYHFAWDGAYGEKTTDFKVQLSNINASCEAIIQAAKIGCRKFVFAGTIAELEIRSHLDNNICKPRGTCIYAVAKLNTEIMCKTLAIQNDISFNCGLFANTIGPGDFSHRSTNSILNKFIHREAPQLVKGDGLNDWLYIRDAVRLIDAMGEYGKNMKTYYIGHTDLWPLRKTIERARDIVAPGLELHFGEIPDAFLTDYRYVDTKELYLDTGCKAVYSFEQAIRETSDWVKKLKF